MISESSRLRQVDRQIQSRKLGLFATLWLVGLLGCNPKPQTAENPAEAPTVTPHPFILLITMDTTRFDHIGFASNQPHTPNLDALAASGLNFTQAYSTAPMTLPAHVSILSGQYPDQHGIRENARFLDKDTPLITPRLQTLGYQTAAFVSAFVLDRKFGIGRGFDRYDDDFAAGHSERRADETTAQALAYLKQFTGSKLFLWVHYFDPHHPYVSPGTESEADHNERAAYLREIAFMDSQIGRLLAGFQALAGDRAQAVIAVGDHGEMLGDHGETFHGHLLYQGAMHVPLIIAAKDRDAEVMNQPASIRSVAPTILELAGEPAIGSLLGPPEPVVLGEAMKSYIQYGWQPQVMAVRNTRKYLRSGILEVYDPVTDPGELNDLSATHPLPEIVAKALGAYGLPDLGQQASNLSQEDQERLASLGYAATEGLPADLADRPNPKDMTSLFADLDEGSHAFVRADYQSALKSFTRVLKTDPRNFAACLRLAICHSLLDQQDEANRYFTRAEGLNPNSIDLKHFAAMHAFRSNQHAIAAPLLEEVLRQQPSRLPAIEALARIREIQGDLSSACQYYEQAAQTKQDPAIFLKLGELYMRQQQTPAAIRAFESAQQGQGPAFNRHLELGVCYQVVGQHQAAAEQLDQVDGDHPGYAMALFKRAQISALRGEPDTGARVQLAWSMGNPQTRNLISRDPQLKPYL